MDVYMQGEALYRGAEEVLDPEKGRSKADREHGGN